MDAKADLHEGNIPVVPLLTEALTKSEESQQALKITKRNKFDSDHPVGALYYAENSIYLPHGNLGYEQAMEALVAPFYSTNQSNEFSSEKSMRKRMDEMNELLRVHLPEQFHHSGWYLFPSYPLRNPDYFTYHLYVHPDLIHWLSEGITSEDDLRKKLNIPSHMEAGNERNDLIFMLNGILGRKSVAEKAKGFLSQEEEEKVLYIQEICLKILSDQKNLTAEQEKERVLAIDISNLRHEMEHERQNRRSSQLRGSLDTFLKSNASERKKEEVRILFTLFAGLQEAGAIIPELLHSNETDYSVTNLNIAKRFADVLKLFSFKGQIEDFLKKQGYEEHMIGTVFLLFLDEVVDQLPSGLSQKLTALQTYVPRPISRQEILEKMAYYLENEGAFLSLLRQGKEKIDSLLDQTTARVQEII